MLMVIPLTRSLTQQAARKASAAIKLETAGCNINGRSLRCTPWLRRIATSTRYREAQVRERWLGRTSRKRLATPVTCPCAPTTCVVRLATIPFMLATWLMAD